MLFRIDVCCLLTGDRGRALGLGVDHAHLVDVHPGAPPTLTGLSPIDQPELRADDLRETLIRVST